MPNRIIKESICTSDTIDKLDNWFDEVFFYRLMVNCDDYGRFDARVAILKARLFPLKDIRNNQIVESLNRLSLAGIVELYEYESRPYLQLTTWANHQTIRNHKGKYPENTSSCMQLKSIEINCKQKKSNASLIQSNPIQSESESYNVGQPKKVYPYKEIVDYLNQRAEKNYFPTAEKTKSLIKARIDEGRTVDDFKKVIDIKVAEWKGDAEWEKYLRPETLFSNKFEGYLNQKSVSKSNNKKTKFNNFTQRNYDFADYEKQLIEKQLAKSRVKE